jgi:hypothetical protein
MQINSAYWWYAKTLYRYAYNLIIKFSEWINLKKLSGYIS